MFNTALRVAGAAGVKVMVSKHGATSAVIAANFATRTCETRVATAKNIKCLSAAPEAVTGRGQRACQQIRSSAAALTQRAYAAATGTTITVAQGSSCARPPEGKRKYNQEWRAGEQSRITRKNVYSRRQRLMTRLAACKRLHACLRHAVLPTGSTDSHGLLSATEALAAFPDRHANAVPSKSTEIGKDHYIKQELNSFSVQCSALKIENDDIMHRSRFCNTDEKTTLQNKNPLHVTNFYQPKICNTFSATPSILSLPPLPLAPKKLRRACILNNTTRLQHQELEKRVQRPEQKQEQEMHQQLVPPESNKRSMLLQQFRASELYACRTSQSISSTQEMQHQPQQQQQYLLHQQHTPQQPLSQQMQQRQLRQQQQHTRQQHANRQNASDAGHAGRSKRKHLHVLLYEPSVYWTHVSLQGENECDEELQHCRTEVLRDYLLYRSRTLFHLELESILKGFLDRHLHAFSRQQLQQLHALLHLNCHTHGLKSTSQTVGRRVVPCTTNPHPAESLATAKAAALEKAEDKEVNRVFATAISNSLNLQRAVCNASVPRKTSNGEIENVDLFSAYNEVFCEKRLKRFGEGDLLFALISAEVERVPLELQNNQVLALLLHYVSTEHPLLQDLKPVSHVAFA